MIIFNENRPIYLQLREEIEKVILTGFLKPDEAIPSIRTLAQQYQLNHQTVSNALSDLVNEGIIYKKRGIGFFVNIDAKENLMKKKSKEFREKELTQIIQKGKSFGISKSEFVDTIELVYSKQGE